jgi:hypothetical protein
LTSGALLISDIRNSGEYGPMPGKLEGLENILQ